MTKYIITDPCYIINKDVWQECCNAAKLPDNGWDDDLFNAKVANELTKMTGQKAWASETGFGDWENTIHGDESKIIQSDFVADSGMVCVCALTPDIESHLKAEYPNGFNNLGAIIECEGSVKVEFDKEDCNWTVVYIDDAVGSFNSCLPPDEYDDDDE